MTEITDDFRNAMSEWIELKKQLAEVRKDVKVLNQREKSLKEYIKGYMTEEKIDNVNLKKGKVTLKKSSRKPTLTRKVVESGLMIFFQDDETKVETVMNCIEDLLEKKETSSVVMTGVLTK